MTTETNGIWYDGMDGARLNEIPLVLQAAQNLGHLVVRVVEDPEEARRIVHEGILTRDTEQRFSRFWTDKEVKTFLPDVATALAEEFVQTMQLPLDGKKMPRRLVWIESTDGSRVYPHDIYEEIKNRVRPGLTREPITTEEVVYDALYPVDPSILLL
jgi:hypothetical protein